MSESIAARSEEAEEEFDPLFCEVKPGPQDNGAMIVINTTPGSASLVARHLDSRGGENILGTIAGDDTIFVAPKKLSEIRQTLKAIRESF